MTMWLKDAHMISHACPPMATGHSNVAENGPIPLPGRDMAKLLLKLSLEWEGLQQLKLRRRLRSKADVQYVSCICSYLIHQKYSKIIKTALQHPLETPANLRDSVLPRLSIQQRLQPFFHRCCHHKPLWACSHLQNVAWVLPSHWSSNHQQPAQIACFESSVGNPWKFMRQPHHAPKHDKLTKLGMARPG